MKRIYLFSILVLCTIGCKKDLTKLNYDPKNPSSVPSYTLFTNAQKSLVDDITTPNVNSGIFRLIVQQWQETTYTDESNYDLVTRQIPDFFWTYLYRDVLRDFLEAKNIIPQDVTDPVTQKNDLAINDIMMVYTWYYLVTTFGNIPYTQALDISNTFPKYDDQKTIYYDLLTRLDADIAALNTSGSSFGQADIVYGGDVGMWKKFAATFKLKMGMTIADSDPAKSKTVVESAVATGVFSSNADNAMFNYLSAPPNANQVWVNLVQSGRQDFVAAKPIIDTLEALRDPRLPFYFTVDANDTYSGGEPGASSNYASLSKPAGSLLVPGSVGKVTNPDFPADLLDYSETEFFLAEAVERGYSVGGTAQQHYNNAITASITFWGGSNADATAYLAQPAVNYTTAAGNYKQKIGIQKWLALYNRGADAWIEWRRLDYPRLVKAATGKSEIPLRFTYPINEQNVNTVNYNQASTAIGGDAVTTKLFWDIY